MLTIDPITPFNVLARLQSQRQQERRHRCKVRAAKWFLGTVLGFVGLMLLLAPTYGSYRL